ncbi:hypothetical protein E4T43_07245 [Aureobasidium subglaciale]|nr:hypothetical protein E4T43_07245 [Aureobasidium subglaciale]
MVELTAGLLLYPEFEILDMAGPLECLNILSVYMGKKLDLHIISDTMEPVGPGTREDGSSTFAGKQLYVPTCTVHDAPSIDLLIVPGGPGSVKEDAMKPFVEYIRRIHTDSKPPKYFFSICSGSLLFAQAGILDDQSATTNKAFWTNITAQGPRTKWIAKARWVVSENIWTTSGVTAGIDGMLALIASVWGDDTADGVEATMEHNRAREAGEDPWAEKYGCEDVLPVNK